MRMRRDGLDLGYEDPLAPLPEPETVLRVGRETRRRRRVAGSAAGLGVVAVLAAGGYLVAQRSPVEVAGPAGRSPQYQLRDMEPCLDRKRVAEHSTPAVTEAGFVARLWLYQVDGHPFLCLVYGRDASRLKSQAGSTVEPRALQPGRPAMFGKPQLTSDDHTFVFHGLVRGPASRVRIRYGDQSVSAPVTPLPTGHGLGGYVTQVALPPGGWRLSDEIEATAYDASGRAVATTD